MITEQKLLACLERCRLALGNITEEKRMGSRSTRTEYDAIDDIIVTTAGVKMCSAELSETVSQIRIQLPQIAENVSYDAQDDYDGTHPL